MIRFKQHGGFTIIELMLSMAFVGALLLAIAVTSMQIMGTYTKGLTVREVNQAGRTITEDIQRTVASSSPFDLPAMHVADTRGGRLCTGTYTYAWNYGKDLDGAALFNEYENNAGGTDREPIRFAKVSDPDGSLCSNREEKIPSTSAKELLPAGDRSVAVQRFSVSSNASDQASGQKLYAIGIVIGTNDHSQIDVGSASCKRPDQGDGDDRFCAINEFNIVVRSSNQSGSIR